MMVVHKTFGKILSAFTWMSQDLYKQNPKDQGSI